MPSKRRQWKPHVQTGPTTTVSVASSPAPWAPTVAGAASRPALASPSINPARLPKAGPGPTRGPVRPGPSHSSRQPTQAASQQPIQYRQVVKNNAGPQRPGRAPSLGQQFVPDDGANKAGDTFFGEDYTSWYQKHNPKKGSATFAAASTNNTGQEKTKKPAADQPDRPGGKESPDGKANSPSEGRKLGSQSKAAPSTVAPVPGAATMNGQVYHLTAPDPSTNNRDTWQQITAYLEESSRLSGAIRPRYILAVPQEPKMDNLVSLRRMLVKAVGMIDQLELENAKLGGHWNWDGSLSIRRTAGLIKEIKKSPEWAAMLRRKNRPVKKPGLVQVDESENEGEPEPEDDDGGGNSDREGMEDEDEVEDQSALLGQMWAKMETLQKSWEALVTANNFLGAQLKRAKQPLLEIGPDEVDDQPSEGEE